MDATHKTKWSRGGVTLFASAVALLVIDRVLKFVVMNSAAGSGGAVQFTLFKNPGIAFSLPLPSVFFWPAALLVFAILIWAFVRTFQNDKIRAGIFFIILLGALSNLIDHVIYGATIDYLIFFNLSAVNLADGMIVAGLLALILERPTKIEVTQ